MSWPHPLLPSLNLSYLPPPPHPPPSPHGLAVHFQLHPPTVLADGEDHHQSATTSSPNLGPCCSPSPASHTPQRAQPTTTPIIPPVCDMAPIVNDAPHTVKAPPSVNDDNDGNDQPPIDDDDSNNQPPIDASDNDRPLSSLNSQELVPGPVASLDGPSHLPAE